MFASNLLRGLAIAAAFLASAAVPALAEGRYESGPVAVPAWTAQSRTPLAGQDSRGNPEQNRMERNGATGGGGQHG